MKSIRIAIYVSIAIHFLRKTCRKLVPHWHIHVDRSKPYYLVLSWITRDGPSRHPPVKIAKCLDYAVARELQRILHPFESRGLACYPSPAPELLPDYGKLLHRHLAVPMVANMEKLGYPTGDYVYENLKAAIRRLPEGSGTIHSH